MRKIAMVYRVLKHHGFLYRTRIYEMSRLQCHTANDTHESPPWVSGLDDVEEKFDETAENESKYTQNNTNFEYADSPNHLFEDFVMPTNSRITALNLYGGHTITYS